MTDNLKLVPLGIFLLTIFSGMAWSMTEANDLRIDFEPGSSRLPASQCLLLDDFFRHLHGQMVQEVSIVVPVSNDMGQQRFIRSRLATLDQEIEKRGWHPNHIPGTHFIVGNDHMLVHPVMDIRPPHERENGNSLNIASLLPEDRPVIPTYAVKDGGKNGETFLLAGRELSGWDLLGAIPGRGWISAPGVGKNGIEEVREGDVHPLLGRIEHIWHDNGRWIVMSSRGWFHGGAS